VRPCRARVVVFTRNRYVLIDRSAAASVGDFEHRRESDDKEGVGEMGREWKGKERERGGWAVVDWRRRSSSSSCNAHCEDRPAGPARGDRPTDRPVG